MVRAILKTLGLFRLRWTNWLLNVADTSASLECSISEPSVRVEVNKESHGYASHLGLYTRLREAFPDFSPEIHWQTVQDGIVTTFKTYHGTHRGEFLGIAPTGRRIHFETVDAMRVRDGKITDHWGVANLYSVLQQLGRLPT